MSRGVGARGTMVGLRAHPQKKSLYDLAMGQRILTTLALAYCRHAPVDIGKSRLSQFVEPYVGPHVATIRTGDNFLMQVDTRDFIQRSIYLTGGWDEGVAQAVRECLHPGALFVDIGANVGYFSLLAAQLGARVIAFEPNPTCLEALVHNAALNGFDTIDARAVGLANQAGHDILYVESETNSGAGSLKTGIGQSYDIELDTLDAQLAGDVPALIKLDIEGAELMVMQGAAATLARTPAVICEVSEYSLRQLGGSKEELLALMARHGFMSEIISPVRRSNHSGSDICFQYDVLFTKTV